MACARLLAAPAVARAPLGVFSVEHRKDGGRQTRRSPQVRALATDGRFEQLVEPGGGQCAELGTRGAAGCEELRAELREAERRTLDGTLLVKNEREGEGGGLGVGGGAMAPVTNGSVQPSPRRIRNKMASEWPCTK